MSTVQPENLTGQFLIAMPGMGDPRFANSVVYMCEHSDEGSMGLIINKPTKELKFTDLLEQLSISADVDVDEMHIHYGGPVEMARGFVLHSGEYHCDGITMNVNNQLGMTATMDVIKDIAAGNGPKQAFLALGYAGWAPNQLEDELMQNGWLTCDADDAIIFETDNDRKWMAALDVLGIDPLLLSAKGGTA